MNAPQKSGWFDSFVNLLTGIGMAGRDKVTSNSYAVNYLTDDQLEAAYRADWIARKVIDIPAQDSTRAWRAWQADDKDITAIEKVEKDLQIQLKMQSVMKKARLYGGAALVLGVAEGKEDQPLDLERVTVDSLKYVHVVTRLQLTAQPLNGDLMSEWYGEPEYYTLNPIMMTAGLLNASMASNLLNVRIHPSRVIRFIGAEYPEPTRGINVGWGDSILQVVDDAIKSIGTVSSSIAQMVSDAKLDIISVPNLASMTSTSVGEARLTRRFAYANLHKSIINAIVLDKEEEWNRVTTHFVGMDHVLQMYLIIASGAADIPVTRLLGQSPAGMNATGESDTRNYYDRIKSDQEVHITPNIKTLDEVLIRSALGSRDETIHYNWNSLWQLDDVQKAALAKSKADTFKIDNDSALIPADIMRLARENQLIEDGFYPGFEQIIDDWEAENGDQSLAPDLNVPPPLMPGQIPNPNDPNATPQLPPGQTPPKQLPPPAKKAAPGTADAIGGGYNAARRARRLQKVQDARPRTLYVRRQLMNTNDVIGWMRQMGFKTSLKPEEFHVTIMYSKQAVDWTKIVDRPWDQDDKTGQMTIPPGGMRMLDKFDGGALVLLFTSSSLSYRHCYIKEVSGASYDYADFQPHMTLSYARDEDLPDLNEIDAYQGPLVFGPEVFEELDAQGYNPNPDEEMTL